MLHVLERLPTTIINLIIPWFLTATLARITTDFGQLSSKPSYLVGVTQTISTKSGLITVTFLLSPRNVLDISLPLPLRICVSVFLTLYT